MNSFRLVHDYWSSLLQQLYVALAWLKKKKKKKKKKKDDKNHVLPDCWFRAISGNIDILVGWAVLKNDR